ncbi:MAG: response regulator [Campylobacterota bacterium]|nr:response regulator [Campylobacterota bacterium]
MQEIEMLETYLMEIVAFVSVVLVTIVYIMIKKSKSKEKTKEEEIKESIDTTIEETTTKEDKEKITIDLETITPEIQLTQNRQEVDLLHGTEEGSFGSEEKVKPKPGKKERSDKPKRVKRDVPPHGKITKDNFKEFSGTRILVAEDNLINQKVISGLLADTGIEITIADDGQDALDILKEDKNFTIILMDAHMPRVDGFQATRLIRANPDYEHIVVVALSGDTASDDIKKMSDAGMEEHLEKPLRMDALYDILYAYSKKKDDSDKFVEVVMTKELNGDKGLEICGGDADFYHEILDEFVKTYSDSTKKIKEFLDNKQLQEADKILLDIVGVTANIGADRVQGIAQNLKEAIHNIEEKSFSTILKEYNNHLEQLLNDIKEYK